MADKDKKPSDFINDVITPPGRAAFCHLKKADTTGEYADDKWKVRLLFEKGTDFKDFQKKVRLCARRKFGKDIQLKDIQVPWTDGDERDDLDGHAGCWYMNLKSTKRPTIVGRKKEDLDPEEIYGGCKIRCVISLMPYTGTENQIIMVDGKKKKKKVRYKGVTCLLDLVQFMGHDEPFGNGNSSAKRDLLDDLEDEDGDIDDLSTDDLEDVDLDDDDLSSDDLDDDLLD